MEASTPPAEVSVKCLDRTGHCSSQPAVRGASWPRPTLKASSRKTSEVASPETTGKRGSRSAQIGSRNGNSGHGRWVSAFPCAADTAGRWRAATRRFSTCLGHRLQGRRRWADDGRDGITETRGAPGLDQTRPVSFARIPNQEPPTPPASACRDPDRRPARGSGFRRERPVPLAQRGRMNGFLGAELSVRPCCVRRAPRQSAGTLGPS